MSHYSRVKFFSLDISDNHLRKLRSACRISHDAASLEQRGLKPLLKAQTVAAWWCWAFTPYLLISSLEP